MTTAFSQLSKELRGKIEHGGAAIEKWWVALLHDARWYQMDDREKHLLASLTNKMQRLEFAAGRN